jgi:hypothetical protein
MMPKNNKNSSKKKRRRKGKNSAKPNPTPNPTPQPVIPEPDIIKKIRGKPLHEFKVNDVVDVYFPKNSPYYLGRARVTEIGRIRKGKDYDIEVTFEYNGEPKAVHAHHLKAVKNPDNYPEIFDQDKVHVRPKYRAGYAGPTTGINPILEDRIRDFLDSIPSPEEEREINKPLGCIRCHNGDLFAKGSRALWKSKEGRHFSVPSYAEYVILVPGKFNAGRISFKNRRRVEACPRCQGGRFTDFSTKHDGSGFIDHKSLLRLGYIGMIVMPTKK